MNTIKFFGVKILMMILLLVSLNSFSQNFEYNENGLTPNFLVKELNWLKQAELFNKSINWIKETYKNPDEVIKTTIGAEKIRYRGAKSLYLCHKALGIQSCFDVRYTIELSFKDGRYKFAPLSLEVYQPYSQYTKAGWYEVSIYSESPYYKKGKLRKMFKQYPFAISDLFYSEYKSLRNYLAVNQA